MKAREWLGNVSSKLIDRFVLEHDRKRLRHLLAMQVPKRQAIPRKSLEGPWHMTKSMESCVGMANAWLAEQGVLSLKSLWAELADLH
jgi:RNA-directed DNA polymerase